MQRQGRRSQETIAQPWDGILVLPQGIRITISLSSSAELNPQQMEDVNYLIKLSSFQREAHQETTWGQIKGMQGLHTPRSLSATPPLSHCYKTPHQILPSVGHTVLKGMSPLCPPLPGKAVKLFFSTSPKTVSEIQFGISAERLSFWRQEWPFQCVMPEAPNT